MTWDALETKITQEITRAVDQATLELTEEFRQEEPVDTGRSKNAWTRITIPTLDGISYQVINPAVDPKTGYHYPADLFNGYSKQLPQGHWPTFDSWLIRLQNDLQNINL